MTLGQVRRAATKASEAAAALIPLAAGGRDGDGNTVVNAAEAVRRAKAALVEALRELEAEE